MHMRSAEVQKQIRYPPGHDQNDECSRRDKGEQKRDKRQPGQMPGRFRQQNVSRVTWKISFRHHSKGFFLRTVQASFVITGNGLVLR
jgi:hypothetical protein